MRIHFHKMEGAGNDFIVIDNFEYNFSIEQIISMAPSLCDRKFGIGADGIMALHPPQQDGLDYTMIYRNADGSDAGMCGNGSRCLAVFAANKGLGTSLSFNVHDAIYKAEVNGEYASISFPDVQQPKQISVQQQDLIQVFTGTEHVVSMDTAELLENENELRKKGKSIRLDDTFSPNGTNVNFVCSHSDSKIQLQTFEKGVEDLTLACGTGAIAAAISSHHLHTPNSSSGDYTVQVKGGVLGISFNYDEQSKTYTNVYLNGPGTFVFEGYVEV